MSKIIKDIRYYASNHPNEAGYSLPQDEYFKKLFGTKIILTNTVK
jgi:hypothetical protein